MDIETIGILVANQSILLKILEDTKKENKILKERLEEILDNKFEKNRISSVDEGRDFYNNR